MTLFKVRLRTKVALFICCDFFLSYRFYFKCDLDSRLLTVVLWQHIYLIKKWQYIYIYIYILVTISCNFLIISCTKEMLQIRMHVILWIREMNFMLITLFTNCATQLFGLLVEIQPKDSKKVISTILSDNIFKFLSQK